MGWVRIDDNFPHHPKVVAAGPVAMALYVSAICYSNAYLTNGFVTKVSLKALLPWPSRTSMSRAASALVDAGLWTVVERGYQIHDYLDYQPGRAQVEAERQAAKERMKARRSVNVRPNTSRTSGEIQEKFNDPTPPHPKDNPKKAKTSSLGSSWDAPETAQAKRRSTRIPENFSPSVEMFSWAAKQRPNVDAQDQTQRFVNHAVANGRTLIDWGAGWRNWILAAEGFGQIKTNGHGPPSRNGHIPYHDPDPADYADERIQ